MIVRVGRFIRSPYRYLEHLQEMIFAIFEYFEYDTGDIFSIPLVWKLFFIVSSVRYLYVVWHFLHWIHMVVLTKFFHKIFFSFVKMVPVFSRLPSSEVLISGSDNDRVHASSGDGWLGKSHEHGDVRNTHEAWQPLVSWAARPFWWRNSSSIMHDMWTRRDSCENFRLSALWVSFPSLRK